MKPTLAGRLLLETRINVRANMRKAPVLSTFNSYSQTSGLTFLNQKFHILIARSCSLFKLRHVDSHPFSIFASFRAQEALLLTSD